MITKLENYRHNLSLIGITIDEVLLLNLYQNLPADVQTGAKVILLPIAAKEGVVYAMDNISGDLVPFSFSRASSATLFDKDKNMELVGNNIPRIDYGNYTDDVKLLVEKESANLLVDSALATSLQAVYYTGLPLIDLDWFNYIKTGRTVPHIDNVDTYIYKRGPVTTGLSYAMSAFVRMVDNSVPNFRLNESNVNGALLIDTQPFSPKAINKLIKDNIYRVYGTRSATRTITGNNGIVKYRSNYGADIITSGYQLEQSDTVTSYIPTTTTTATRAADKLTYTLPASSGIYLKTNKQSTLLNKPKGIWNIHEDLNNEGIEALAIFYEDIIIGFDEETAVEEFIIPIRDKNQVVKARYALKDTDIEKNALMSEHYIEISFALDSFVRFVRSDYIIWEGEKYIIKEDYIPDEVNKCNYKYTLRFDHWTTLLQDDTFYYMNQNLEETEWSLMANAATHFQLLSDNANRYFGVNSFNVGTIEFTDLKYIRFDKVSIWDAATQIAKEYGGEWYLTGTTFHLVKKFSYGSEIDFESEVSVEKMERSKGEDSEKYTRILAFGSTRNIPANYRETTPGETVNAIFQKRLRIPISKGKFIDAKPNMSPEEIKSAVVIFDEVYPKRIGTIETVGTIPYQDTDTDTGVVINWNAYKFKDTGINFKKEYLFPGKENELGIHFESGILNGMDFYLRFHESGFSETDNSQYFEIVRNENYGKALPNDTLKPQNGDTYILYGFNIQLVSDQYVPAGEQELYDTAVEWQQDMLKDKSVFECPTMIQHFADNEMDLEIGQKVKLIHDQFEGGFRSSRIQGYEKRLLNKYQATYTVGDNSAASWAKSVDNSIKELQIAGITYQATGKNGVYLITQFDNTPASDFNAYSAKASDARYLNKQTGGTVQGDVLFQKKIKAKEAISDQFGNETFTSGQFGNGFRTWLAANGQSYAEFDNLMVRREMIINTLTIAEIKSVGGQILLSLANMYCNAVTDGGSYWKCSFDTSNGTIANQFAVDDQVICRKFNGANIKYYWARVTSVGTDYINISKTDKDGTGIPEINDEIIQFGNRTNSARQSAIILSAYGSDAPSFKQYAGINSYDLTGKEVTVISPSGNKFTGDFVIQSSGKNVTTAISEVDTKASNAQASANTANAGLLSKVAYSEYNAQMQVLDTRISSKVSQTDFNTLGGRVSATESSITQQAGQISSVVEKVNVLDQKGINRFIRIGWVSGGWSPTIGSVLVAQANSTRIRPNTDAFLAALSNALYSFKNDNITYQAVIYELDKNKKLIKNHGWVDGNYQFTTLSTTAYFAFLGRKRTDANISASDIWSFTCKLEQGDFTDYSVAPEDMSYLVNNAQATADSKTRTYYQDAQPTTPSGGFSVGDIWQKVTYTDTTGVVNMDSSKNVCRFEYRWNGSTWVQINFNVTGSYVTQTNDSISSLVSKTGINSLGAGETLKSLIDQTPDKITLAVSAIQIGGVNKFRNTNFLSSANRSFTPPSIAWLNENRGKQMAISLYINTENAILSGNKRIGAEFYVVFSDGTNGYFGVWMAFPDTATTYKGRISRTFTFPDKQVVSVGYCQTFFQTFVSGTANAGYPKLEEGNKATAWTEAPEDTQSQIDGKTTLGEVSSSLTMTDNKIILASKTLELKGTTIAKAIEAEDLKVGSRTGLSALEVLKNGTFYAKGSTSNNSSLIIDSSTQSITITSPKSTSGEGNNISGSSNVTISGESGGVRVDGSTAISSNSATIVSNSGIFANTAGQGIFPAATGISARASIVGLGWGNVTKDTYADRNFVAGVYGSASNSGSAPAFGGYFDLLRANGLYLAVRRISTGTTLNKYDCYVSCYNTSDITVYLPSSPYTGQVIYIRQMNSNGIMINGNGISIHTNGDTVVWTWNRAGRGDTTMLIYDGQYWNLNYMPR